MSPIIVSKFGGSSMADHQAMERSAALALSRNSNVVFVSATYGTTNDLIAITDQAQVGNWEKVEPILTKLNEKHKKIADDIGVSQDVRDYLKTLYREGTTLARGMSMLKECSLKANDSFISLGERSSSALFSECVRKMAPEKKVVLFDIRQVLKTDQNHGKAIPQIELIEKYAKELLVCDENTIYITQGFIGEGPNKSTTTLGRGGSDYSAALIAEALNANSLEIWTDVPGMASTDPRLCPKAKAISNISFQEAAEMATFGAKILHPATLAPAMRKEIPVFVGSSYEPAKGGTWIEKSVDQAPLVRAVTMRKNQSLLTLSNPKMLNAYGFLGEIFQVFNRNQVSVDAITTSEISVAMTVDDNTALNSNLIEELEQLGKVEIEKDLTLVALIGNNINHTPGLANNIFSELVDINVRMICLGASRHNFCFLVKEDQAEDALQRLHNKFLEVEQ